MATIVVDIPGIPGESIEEAGKIDALGINESIEILASGFSATAAPGKSAGTGVHGDIQIIKYRDTSSPKLAEAAANNKNLQTVQIKVLTGPGGDVFMTYQLENVFVSRMEHETLDEASTAFFNHHDPGQARADIARRGDVGGGGPGVGRDRPRPGAAAVPGAAFGVHRARGRARVAERDQRRLDLSGRWQQCQRDRRSAADLT